MGMSERATKTVDSEEEQHLLEGITDSLRKTGENTAELRMSIDNLASQEYVDELHGDSLRTQRRQLWITATIVFFAVLFSGINMFLLFQVLHIAEDNNVNNEILVDCLTESLPNETHECYERASEFSDRLLDNQNQILDNIEDLLIQIEEQTDRPQNGQQQGQHSEP